MERDFKSDTTYIVDLEILNTFNARGCASCHAKFCLGETVVMAVGDWEGDNAQLIHETHAVFDKETSTYYDKSYYLSTH